MPAESGGCMQPKVQGCQKNSGAQINTSKENIVTDE